jgi:hypothetical protein
MTQSQLSNLKYLRYPAFHITLLHLPLEQHLICPPGHATHSFKAYDILWDQTVFLKDSWRVDLLDIQAEGVTYRMLRIAGVCNIPHCLASSDISTARYHAMKTCDYTRKPWACHIGTLINTIVLPWTLLDVAS